MLTFESIRELERAERESKKLQRLPENFCAELSDYIIKKEHLGADGDVLELHSIKGTVARLLEMRERKIIDSALITARTGLPPESLSPSETELFWVIVEKLKKFRDEFIGQIGHGRKQERREASEAAITNPKQWNVVQQIEFVGPDMKNYNLKPGEILELPDNVVEILLKQGVIKPAENGK